MSRWKKVLLGAGIVLVALIIAFVVVVGPWPVYTSGFENSAYYGRNLAAIDKSVAESKVTDAPGRLQAGWGTEKITPAAGTPMAGYSARKGKPATGAHDDLFVKALAFSDGDDCAVVVGADMLIIPPNVAEMVRKQVAEQVPLSPSDILFTASHTHDGPGAFAPGMAGTITGGRYDPKIPPFLATAFANAIVKAYRSLEPAKFAHGSVDAPQFIRNRAREAPVDSELNYMVVQKDSSSRCFLVRYSAHPTTVSDDFMQFTGEYPGALQRTIEEATGATCMYLGGALGSMGPRAPEGPSAVERAEAMGKGLADLVLASASNLPFAEKADVVSIGVPIETPSFQVRISDKWRLSPLLPSILGLEKTAWMQSIRVGNVVLVGVPGDFSGEISIKWKEWAEQQGIDLWPTSFCAAYMGYISPDQYYGDLRDKKGGISYEIGAMSWMGPHQEAFFTALMKHMVDAMGKPVPPKETSANVPVRESEPS